MCLRGEPSSQKNVNGCFIDRIITKKGCKLSFESGRKISTALMGEKSVKPIAVPKVIWVKSGFDVGFGSKEKCWKAFFATWKMITSE